MRYDPLDAEREAGGAEGERLWELIRPRHPRVVSRAALNKHLNEDMAVYIAKGKSTPQEVLGMLAGDVRFKASYPLKLAICRNPRTSLRVAMTLLKFIKLFDLADMTREPNLPSVLRQRVEAMLYERIPTMPAGVKIALARRASSNVILRIMERSDRRVIDSCLESPRMTEEQVRSLLFKESIRPAFVRALAENPKWSLRYGIRYALIRHPLAPLSAVEGFISDMRGRDLKELYLDTDLPSSIRPFIHSELLRRGATPGEPETEEVYEMDEDEGQGLEDVLFESEPDGALSEDEDIELEEDAAPDEDSGD